LKMNYYDYVYENSIVSKDIKITHIKAKMGLTLPNL
jgi:hypothetical protein